MYNNYYRDDNNEDLCLYDPQDVYDLETQDLPMQCPYVQMYFNQFALRSQQLPQSQPPSAPPAFTPQETQAQHYGGTTGATTFVDPGAIKPCVFRFVYIWPRRGKAFWAWLTFVGRRSVAGFRWDGRRWRYFGMDLRDIRSFRCY